MLTLSLTEKKKSNVVFGSLGEMRSVGVQVNADSGGGGWWSDSSRNGVFFIFNLFILFIYFWLHWVFVAVRGFSLVVASRGYSSLWCTGFSLQWLLLLRSMGSRRAGFSSCRMWAQ